MTRLHPVPATIAACLAATGFFAGGAAFAQHPERAQIVAARPTVTHTRPLYGQLADGNWVMAYRDQLFYVGQHGVRSLCPDGTYDLRNGSRLPVLAAHIVPPWVKQGFNPQPEPPGRELRALTSHDQRLVIAQGNLYFEGRGSRTRCGSGTYALRGGGSVRVVGGQIQDPAHLVGFAP